MGQHRIALRMGTLCIQFELTGAALPQDQTPNGDKVHRVDKPVLPGALSEEAILVEKLQKELRTVAALEVLLPALFCACLPRQHIRRAPHSHTSVFLLA